MLAAVKGIIQGNSVVIDNENLEEYEGMEVVATFLEYPKEKKSDRRTLKEIQAMFEDDKGWDSEEEMIADMARFRRERMSK